MSGYNLAVLFVAFALFEFHVGSSNASVFDACGVYGYNYDTKYGYFIAGSTGDDGHGSVYKYLVNNDSLGLIGADKIGDVNVSSQICQVKSTQMNNKIYIIDDKLSISMYDMNKEVCYNKYTNVPHDIKCDIEHMCVTSDNNDNLYISCGVIFYYYSSNDNKWIKGNNLKYSTHAGCAYSNDKFYVFNNMGIQYIDVNKDIAGNEFNVLPKIDLVMYSES